MKDFVGIAKTGSGKTLAFMVPAWLNCVALDYENEENGKQTVAKGDRRGQP